MQKGRQHPTEQSRKKEFKGDNSHGFRQKMKLLGASNEDNEPYQLSVWGQRLVFLVWVVDVLLLESRHLQCNSLPTRQNGEASKSSCYAVLVIIENHMSAKSRQRDERKRGNNSLLHGTSPLFRPVPTQRPNAVRSLSRHI
jgi:hypothetical protein